MIADNNDKDPEIQRRVDGSIIKNPKPKTPQSITRQRERKRRRNMIASMLRRGQWNQRVIAEKLGMSTKTVSLYIQRLEKEWLETTNRDMGILRSQQLAELTLVKEEAWHAWERSKKKGVKSKVKKKTCDSGDEKQVEKETEERVGNSQFLETIRKSLEQSAKLLGLNVEKHALTDKTGEHDLGSQVMSEIMRLAESGGNGSVIDGDFVDAEVRKLLESGESE